VSKEKKEQTSMTKLGLELGTEVDKGKELEEYILTIFEEVWKIYPRKVSKVRGKRTFLKLFKGVNTREDAKRKGGKIYGAVEKQKRIWDRENTEETFIPYFSSWLNANFE